LTDDFADLGPPASVPVQERDPSMPERVRRKVCHPRISTRPPNGHAETVGGHAIEEGYSCVAVLPGREPFDDYVEQVIGKFDPPRTTGLGHGGAYEPRFPAFVQITDAGGLQFANTDSGRVEDEEADEVLRGQKPGSGLDRIVRAHEVSDRSIVVETIDGRELRITAWRDLGSGQYVSDYERRSVIKSGGKEFRVWAHTPAYKRRIADDVASCLEAAVLEVDRINVY
jgi:hypothetical protein